MSETNVMEPADVTQTGVNGSDLRLNLSQLERRDDISPEEFYSEYFKARRPVVFRNF